MILRASSHRDYFLGSQRLGWLWALPLILTLSSCKHLGSLYSSKEDAKALSSMPVFSHDIHFALKPFTSCKELSANLRDSLVKGINAELEKRAEQYDPNNPDKGMILPMATEAKSMGADAQVARGGSQDYTKTNNQVAGVEEGDVVVTDGQVIYQALGHEVRRYKVDREGRSERLEPIVLDDSRSVQALALTRETPHRLVVVANYSPKLPEQRIQPIYRHGGTFQMPTGQTAVEVYNLEGGSDTVAAEPRLVDSFQFAGYFDQLRLTGHILRVLSRSSVQIGGGVTTYVPNYDFKAKKYLSKDEYTAKTQAAIAANLRQVHKTSDSALLSGGYTYSGNRGAKTIAVRQTTEDCKRIYSNARKFGLYQQFTDVMSINLSDGEVREDKFLVDSSDAYFTGDTLYLSRHGYRGAQGEGDDQEAKNDASADANERLSAGRDPNYTTIHKLSYDRLNSSHQGSVTIPGSMLNRYALSEYDMVLRVAVTENRPKFTGEDLDDEAAKSTRPRPAWESESYVYTLGDDAEGQLSVLGRVGGLGKNERIYAVRYFGDKGYVVTFRKTDPLYTLDLSDPTEPKVIGELKIPGFSTYMHGIGSGRLLAIGKDADLTGRVRGVKVSLFDVSDFAAPKLASEIILAENSYSEATYNPKAFNWNALRSFLAIPMSYWYAYGKERRSGDKIIGLMVDNDKLIRGDDFGFARDPAAKPGQHWLRMKRAIMVGDALYTITEHGVKGYHYQKGEQADN